MHKIDIFKMAYKNLMRRKVRTFLTVLGVLIGTTSIVVMISLGIGLAESQTKMLESWGSLNEIEVQAPYEMPGMGDGNGQGENPLYLNEKTLEEFRNMPGVVAVAPVIQTSGEMKYGKKIGHLQIMGIDEETMEQFQYKIGEGRLLESNDRLSLVLGGISSDMFYDPNNPPSYGPDYVYDEQAIYQSTLEMLNKRLVLEARNMGDKTKKYNFQVIGVLSLENGSKNYSAFAPIDEIKKIKAFTESGGDANVGGGKKKNKNEFDSVTILTEDVAVTTELANSLREQGYMAYSIADQLEGVEKMSMTIQAVLGGIGGITLIVAAIGIINTMVMSIYERTKEIGIMKVIGASFSDIRLMFLTEAGLIGLLGGIVGLGLSYGLSYIINILSAGYMNMGMADPNTAANLSVIPPWLAVFAVIFSILVGVLAGLYPANRAVKLSPITAIRGNE